MRSAAVAAMDRPVVLAQVVVNWYPGALPRRATLARMLSRPTTWASDKNVDAIPTQIAMTNPFQNHLYVCSGWDRGP